MSSSVPEIGAFKICDEAILPVRSTEFAACYDLHACLVKSVSGYDANNNKITVDLESDERNFVTLKPGYRLLIPSGFIFDIPEGYSIRFHPRSGMALKMFCVLANAEAVIDHDYVEQSFAILVNNSEALVRVYHGDRVCQMELVKEQPSRIQLIEKKPERRGNRTGGLGHTGS